MAGRILVTGDVVLHVNLYVGGRMTPDSEMTGTQIRKTPGGAMITYTLLRELAGKKPDPRLLVNALKAEDLLFGINEPTAEKLETWPIGFHASALWEVQEVVVDKKMQKRWCPSKSRLGYGSTERDGGYPARPIVDLKTITPRILVIDDGMLGFRKRTGETCWPAFIKGGPKSAPEVEWIVLKMSSPLGHGDLWHVLSDKWKERLILIVSAADLRRADVRLTRGLSWDQTVEDFIEEIEKQRAFANLSSCRHLVVTLASDGAIWLSNPGGPANRRGHLVFDRKRAEGEFDEETGRPAPYGSLSAMAASIAWRLWYDGRNPDLTPALKAGLSAARVLRECGHGLAESPELGFPLSEVAGEICTPIITRTENDGQPTGDVETIRLSRHTYASVSLPTPKSEVDKKLPYGRPDVWTILKANTEGAAIGRIWSKEKPLPPLSGTGRRLALFGPGSLSGVPYARFGKLLTMDRGDIESLRSIRQLMLRYKAEEKPKNPLSIAVFGAPGSGKSFGLKQIAESIFHDKALEFNLSQFKGPEELYGAYHQVRDKVLSGVTPVVFWDEFDSRGLMWLQYLLAPMQDGVFQEGQLTHSIGKCVFVMAGSTTYNYKYFGPLEPVPDTENEDQKRARLDFVLKKGPDFKSRLTACLNVLGPNPRQLFNAEMAAKGHNPWYDDPADIEYPVRRAILLRGLLNCAGRDDDDKPLKIDSGLLTAMLEVGHYRNGARSMEKLLTQIVAVDSVMPTRANLPHRNILELLVHEIQPFYDLLCSTGFDGDIEEMAKNIHQRFLAVIKKLPDRNPESDQPWQDLTPELKGSNRAAVQRIPEILAAVGLAIVKGESSPSESEAVDGILRANLEMLAQMEHDGWMDEKKRQGWTLGEIRDNDRLKHPLMIPYGDLPEAEKNKDRDIILRCPQTVKESGCKIVIKHFAQ